MEISKYLHDKTSNLIDIAISHRLITMFDLKNVNYQNMVAVLIEANKEQQKLIEDLQERVKKLESS